MAVSRDPEFRTVRMREGYDLDEVDDFVDRVIDALDGRGPGMSPQEIEAEEFKVVRMREGYVMDDVDDWLDNAAAELRRLRKAPQGQGGQPQAPPAQGPVGHPQAGPPPGAQVPAAQHQPAPRGQAPYDPGPPMHADYPSQPAAPQGYPAAGPAPAAGGYPTYQDAHQDTSFHGAGHTTNHGGPTLDPMTDSAVHELDPALRALDPSFPSGQAPAAPPQAPPAPAGPPQTPPPQTPPAQPAPPAQPTAPPQAPPAQPGYAAAAAEPGPDETAAGATATPATGLHHVEIWTTDLELATKSFGWLFERLGWTLFQVWDNGRSWQSPGGGPYVVIERSPDLTWVAYDRKAPGLNHLALAVPEQWMVDRIVSEAPTYGWRLMFADRHPYAGGPHHYAAYMENEEGFEVEVVAS